MVSIRKVKVAQKPGSSVRNRYSCIYGMIFEIERAHRFGSTGNQRPIIVKFLKSKEKIKSKIKQMQSDDEEWANPHRVADDFAPGVREDRKELFKYMKLAGGEERNAYLSFNKLIIDGATFMYNRVKCELEAMKNAMNRQLFTTMYCLLCLVIVVIRGLFGKFVGFGHKMFKYRYTAFIF